MAVPGAARAAAFCAFWLHLMQVLAAAVGGGLKAAAAARPHLEDLFVVFCSVSWHALAAMAVLGYSAWAWLLVGATELGKAYLFAVDWLHEEFAKELANPRQPPRTVKTYPIVRNSKEYHAKSLDYPSLKAPLYDEPEPLFSARRRPVFRDSSSVFSASQQAFGEPQYSRRSGPGEGKMQMGGNLHNFSNWKRKQGGDSLQDLVTIHERLNSGWDMEASNAALARESALLRQALARLDESLKVKPLHPMWTDPRGVFLPSEDGRGFKCPLCP